jgi:hypothetical protein
VSAVVSLVSLRAGWVRNGVGVFGGGVGSVSGAEWGPTSFGAGRDFRDHISAGWGGLCALVAHVIYLRCLRPFAGRVIERAVRKASGEGNEGI